MKSYAIAYLATALVFIGLDAIWLTVMAQRIYRPLIGDMLLDGFRIYPAVLFYLVYICAVVFFAIVPALATGRWITAMSHGALLGLVAYATYDLTNQATLRNWPVTVTIADLCWGTFVTGVAATAGFMITRAVTRVT